MTLEDKVRENLATHRLAARGDRLLLAVSGGVDSMVMFRLFLELAQHDSWNLSIAHFNHQLRGPESDRDESFVSEQARNAQLPFYAGSGEVRALAESSGISIEMAARQLRHAFLAETAQQIGARSVVLAHHEDDQVETFWLRLLRGHTGDGLSGMRWKSQSPADSRVPLIRPMLNLSKAEILRFAMERNIGFQEDSSNADLHFQRNRLRLEILPALENYQPQLRKITLRLAEVLGAEKEFLRHEAQSANYADAPDAVRREMIRQQLVKLGLEPEFALIEELRRSEKPMMVAPETSVRLDQNGQVWCEKSQPTERDRSECSISVESGGGLNWSGLFLAWGFEPCRGNRLQTEQFDADVVGDRVVLRHWHEGDRFQPIGLGYSIKVQDFFTNLKVPESERHRRVLAVTQAGDIFWIEGTRIGEIAKVTGNTRRVLHWGWIRTLLDPSQGLPTELPVKETEPRA